MNLKSPEFLINVKNLPDPESEEYNAFWENEDKKITEGVTINGFYFSPFIYWHLNYSSIYLDVQHGKRVIRTLGRPQLWDTYLLVDDTIHKAETHEDGKKGVVMVGSRRISKELADYEPVMTPFGEKPIGSMQIGDIVYGKDGKTTNVIEVAPQGIKPIYRMYLLDGRYIDCGLEHQWEVIRKSDNKTKVYQTQDLLKKKLKFKHKKGGYSYKYYLPPIQPVEYEEKSLPINPYILGFLLGDGAIRQGTPVFCTVDEEVETYFKEILGPDYEITHDLAEIKKLGYKCRRYIKYVGKDKWSKDNEYKDIHGINPIRRKIDELGLNKNSHDKFIPELYKRASVEQRFELLRGLMDSDGSINTNGSIEFSVNNEVLANDVAYLCRGLGIRCEVKKEDKGIINKKWSDGHHSNIHALKWRVYIRTDKPIFKLKRKLERIKSRKNTSAVAIDRIEYLCEYSATCIAVDNSDHIFLTKDYIPTHNTVLTSSYIAHKAVTLKGGDHLISALNQPDLNNTTQAVDLILRNLPEYFKFPRIEDDWKKQVTLGYKDKQNVRHEWSKIHVRNFNEGNNTEAAAGLTLSSFMLEEAGKGDMLAALAATVPCFDSPYGWRCSPIVIGTSGDMTKAGDLEELFNNPEAYNFLPVEVNETGKSYGLFVPGTKSLKVPREEVPFSLYIKDEKPSELDNIKIWVADEAKGKDLILKNREQVKKASGLEAYLKEVMYYPLTHEECFLELSQNIFPVDLLQEQLSKLVNQDIKADNVELYLDTEGRVRHKFTDKKAIENFPVKASDDLEGCVQIWEYPITDAPYGLYTAGCLPPGEKVLTDKGMMNIEDITMSEKLISKDGKFVDIYSLERYYLENAPNFEVKVSNTFRTTTFTEEHPIFINGKGLKPYQIKDTTEFAFKEVKHLKVGDWIKVPNFYRNNSYKEFDFSQYWEESDIRINRKVEPPLNNADFWWLVGCYLGDGWVTGNKVSFAINSKETYYLEKLQDITEKYLNRSNKGIRERNNALEYTINSEELSNFLVFHFRKYAEGKNIPEWVKYLPEEHKTQLIHGYLASDGCITKHTKGYCSTEFVSINLELLESFQDILLSLGIVSNLSKLRNEGKSKIGDNNYDSKKCYHLRMGNGSTISLIEKINDNLDPKIQKVDLNVLKKFGKQKRSGCFMSEDLSYIYFQVTEIKVKLFTGIVYNFHCETNTFMCHHITTHNTDPYKQSEAHYSTSLGSTYIYKRVHNLSGEGWQNIVVAAYTGRPKKIEKWYEMTKLLLKYYNAKSLVENMDYGFIQHCLDKQEAHRLLEKTPTFLNDIHPNSTVNREYGIHMTKDIKNYLMSLIIEYVTEVIDVERDKDGNIIKEKLGVTRILDPLLIKELIKFTPKLNVDRVISFGLTLAMARSLNNRITVSSTSQDERLKEYFRANKKGSLFRTTRSPFRGI